MGQKVNPISFRLGYLYGWKSKWFADRKNYKKYLQQDILIRKYLKAALKDSSISKVEVERSSKKIKINITSAKPGFIIGRGGNGIDELKIKLKNKFFASEKVVLEVNVFEVKQPNLDSQLIVQMIASGLEKRVPFRKVMKQALGKVEKAGAKGVKITVSGRLNGVDIARAETLSVGKIPLHTLRADIDYSRGVARTTYGAIGIKVWIYKGDVFVENKEQKDSTSRLKKKFFKKKK